MNWALVCRAEELGPGLHLRTHGRIRYVMAVIDGDVTAFSAVCPHAGGPLEFAETKGHVISCPLHGWSFDLSRGGCEMHGFRPLRMFAVRIENGAVYVALPDSAAQTDKAEEPTQA